MLLARGHYEGLDGVDEESARRTVNTYIAPKQGGNNAEVQQGGDSAIDEQSDPLNSIGKLLNDAGRMLLKRMSISSLKKSGKSKSKGRNASFDTATIRVEDESVSPIHLSSSESEASDATLVESTATIDDGTPESKTDGLTEPIGISHIDMLSEAALMSSATSEVRPTAITVA